MILIIGATGTIGKHIIDAAKNMNVPLRVLMRASSAADPAKQKLVAGCEIVEGDLTDEASLIKACTGVDAVILFATPALSDVSALVNAAKVTGVKRIVPPEFSCCLIDEGSKDVYGYEGKVSARKAIADAGIAWTAIQSNGFMEWFGPACFNMLKPAFPSSVEVYGEGNVKLGLSSLPDIATVTLRAALDPRAANKHVMISFPDTLYTQNEMISLWEAKSGTKVARTAMTESDLERRAEKIKGDASAKLEAITLAVVRGYVFRSLATCKPLPGVLNATELYPEIKGKGLGEFFDALVAAGPPSQ